MTPSWSDEAGQSAILLPVAALVGWTLLVLALVPYRRFKAGFAGQVTGRDFKYGESSAVPPHVSIPNRNFMNLLEVPVLFYVVCLTLYVTGKGDLAHVAMAWAFVALRVAHSLVHLTYNRVMHRLGVFAAAVLVLVAMWLRLLLALVR
jgi:hypothetical protein